MTMTEAATDYDSTKPRWKVKITYRDTPVRTVLIEEIKELQAIIERGPNWNLLDRIIVTLNRRSDM
jgi:hypothetical protein